MEVEDNLAVTAGTCAVMGTASTMACLSEALGISLPGSAAVPAVHADRLRIAEAWGVQAVRLAASGLTLDQIVTRESIENALECCWPSVDPPMPSSTSRRSLVASVCPSTCSI